MPRRSNHRTAGNIQLSYKLVNREGESQTLFPACIGICASSRRTAETMAARVSYDSRWRGGAVFRASESRPVGPVRLARARSARHGTSKVLAGRQANELAKKDPITGRMRTLDFPIIGHDDDVAEAAGFRRRKWKNSGHRKSSTGLDEWI